MSELKTWCRWCGTVYLQDVYDTLPLFGFKRTKSGLRMGRYCTFRERDDVPECRFVVTMDAPQDDANRLIAKILKEEVINGETKHGV